MAVSTNFLGGSFNGSYRAPLKGFGVDMSRAPFEGFEVDS